MTNKLTSIIAGTVLGATALVGFSGCENQVKEVKKDVIYKPNCEKGIIIAESYDDSLKPFNEHHKAWVRLNDGSMVSVERWRRKINFDSGSYYAIGDSIEVCKKGGSYFFKYKQNGN